MKPPVPQEDYDPGLGAKDLTVFQSSREMLSFKWF